MSTFFVRNNDCSKPKKVLIELQKLFGKMEIGYDSTVSTYKLTKLGFNWHDDEAQVQHDIGELSTILMDGIERSLQATHNPQIVNLRSILYQGVIINEVTCHDCGFVR